MRILSAIFLILIGLAAAAAYFALFIVDEKQQAVVLEFGKPKKVIREPGLNWKIPLVDTVDFFDKRILDLDTTPLEVIASDQKRLVVDAFARWRIKEPLKFFQSVRDERIARSRLGALLESSLRRVLGSVGLQDIVQTKREELMREIARQMSLEADQFGVEVVDVRIKRADLPTANAEAIYERMKTERQQQASQIRAEGEEKSRRIKADADRQAVVVRANATRESEKIRGDGDGERNKIFADAFGKDADFFAFYRSMQAYEAGLQGKDTRLVLSPDSDFFRYFRDPAGAKSGASPR